MVNVEILCHLYRVQLMVLVIANHGRTVRLFRASGNLAGEHIRILGVITVVSPV